MSSETFTTFLSAASVGFCVITKESIILEVNNAFTKIASVKEPIGEKLTNFFATEGDFENFLEKTEQKGSASLEVNFNLHKDDFFAIANATLISTANNQKQSIAILFTEVNKRKNLEHQLEERIAIEMKKNREKEEIMNQQAKLATMGEMIGNIAHQWRQPLNILALVFQDIYIKFQLGGLDAEQMEKNYEKVNNLLQYMSQTIDDFRTFFKSEEGDAVFGVTVALNSVFDLVGTRFSSNNTECHIDLESDAAVLGTENGFKQVVINLLNNAQEAILSKSPEKGIINVDVKKEKSMVVVTVADNGGGVPKKILNQIFEPYFTTKHKTQGTGLGLYMSKQIIEQHMAGRLEVENGKEGAIFKISLPLHR
jgi:PAS domain S-box-containing protein